MASDKPLLRFSPRMLVAKTTGADHFRFDPMATLSSEKSALDRATVSGSVARRLDLISGLLSQCDIFVFEFAINRRPEITLDSHPIFVPIGPGAKLQGERV